MFETDLSRLRDFHRLGVRVIQPTYNRRSLLGDGCRQSPPMPDLAKAGVEAVEQMNELGIWSTSVTAAGKPPRMQSVFPNDQWRSRTQAAP